jgi:hypothetical protein
LWKKFPISCPKWWLLPYIKTKCWKWSWALEWYWSTLSQSYIPPYVLSTGEKWPNRKAHVRCFTPQTKRKGSQKSFGKTIIFCVHPAIIDSQSARKGLVRRELSLRFPCACHKFKITGKRRKVASIQLRDTYLCLAFHLRSPCQVRTT